MSRLYTLVGGEGNDWFYVGQDAGGTFTLEGNMITAASGYDKLYAGGGSDTVVLLAPAPGQPNFSVMYGGVENLDGGGITATISIAGGVLGSGVLYYTGSDPSTGTALFFTDVV